MKRETSKREQEHAAMLREALARPGVRGVMEVYDNWREKDRGLDAYRAATKTPASTTTTNPHPSALSRWIWKLRIGVRCASESAIEGIVMSSRIATGSGSK